jgi:hypothetical protein
VRAGYTRAVKRSAALFGEFFAESTRAALFCPETRAGRGDFFVFARFAFGKNSKNTRRFLFVASQYGKKGVRK